MKQTTILSLAAFLLAALSGLHAANTPAGPSTTRQREAEDVFAKPHVVQNVSGYNSWPMIQAIGEKLVCVYSRGTAHTIDEDARAIYARTSTDHGKT